jgi:hypothetical protein
MRHARTREADVADDSKVELQEELRELDENVAVLRRNVEEMRQRIADHSEGSSDRVDLTNAITEAEQEEAILATLEARRTELAAKLGL